MNTFDYLVALPPSYVLFSMSVVLGLIFFMLLNRFGFKPVKPGDEFVRYLMIGVITVLLVGFSYLMLMGSLTDTFTSSIGRMVFLSKDRTHAGDIVEIPSLVWDFDPRYENYDLVKLSQTVKATSYLHPITENPKVRDFRYNVELTPLSVPSDALLWAKALQQSGLGEEDWLKFQLYEFNELYSKDAAKFYNPLDAHQQLQFRALLEEFMEPRLDVAGRSLGIVEFKF